ncbi:MAG: hypothetical protein ACE5HK_02565 [Candidatus Methylomirabilales bacterium]
MRWRLLILPLTTFLSILGARWASQQGPQAPLAEIERELETWEGRLTALEARRERERRAYEDRRTAIPRYPAEGGMSVATIEGRLGDRYRIRDARLVARAEKVRRRIAELRQERLRRRGSTLPA